MSDFLHTKISISALYFFKIEFVTAMKIKKSIYQRKKQLPLSFKKSFNFFLNVVPDAIIVTDSKGYIVMLNQLAEELFLGKETELLGTKIENLISTQSQLDNANKIKKVFSSLKKQNLSHEKNISVKTTIRPQILIEINCRRFIIKKEFFVITTLREITERKKNEAPIDDSLGSKEILLKEKIALLQEKEALLKQLQHREINTILKTITTSLIPNFANLVILSTFDEVSNDFEMAIDSDIFASFELVKNYNKNIKQGVIQNPFCKKFVSNLKKPQLFDDIIPLRNLKNFKNDLFLNTLITKIVFNSCIIIPLKITDEKNFGFILCLMAEKSGKKYTVKDLEFIEEYSHLCAQALLNTKLVKKLEKSIEVRDNFLSIASHELKTPLTTLKLQLQITQRNLVKVDTSATFIELEKELVFCLKQIEYLIKLVDDLLDVSKIRSEKIDLHFSKINLSQLLEDTLSKFKILFENSKNSLTINIEKDLLGVWDTERIQQVITNIFNNVIKHSPGTGVNISALREQNKIVIKIQDFGPGIDLQEQKKLFKRFERAKASKNIGGLGLGLFLSKKIIEAHKGTIRLYSSKGNGCLFKIELPIISDYSEIRFLSKEMGIG